MSFICSRICFTIIGCLSVTISPMCVLDSERSSCSPPALPSPSHSCHRQHCSVNISFCKSSLDYTTLSRTFISLNYACIRSYSKSLLYQFVYGWEPTTLYKSVCSKQASSVAGHIIYLWRTWTIQLRSSASLLCVCVCVGSHCEQ